MTYCTLYLLIVYCTVYNSNTKKYHSCKLGFFHANLSTFWGNKTGVVDRRAALLSSDINGRNIPTFLPFSQFDWPGKKGSHHHLLLLFGKLGWNHRRRRQWSPWASIYDNSILSPGPKAKRTNIHMNKDHSKCQPFRHFEGPGRSSPKKDGKDGSHVEFT